MVKYAEDFDIFLVDNVENKEFLHELLEAMCEELPAPKKKKWAIVRKSIKKFRCFEIIMVY